MYRVYHTIGLFGCGIGGMPGYGMRYVTTITYQHHSTTSCLVLSRVFLIVPSFP